MDGISAVTARITEIRAMLQPPVLAVRSVPALPPGTAAAKEAALAPSFADVLAQAGRPPGTRPVAVSSSSSEFENGRIPVDALTPVGDGDHRLAQPAATALVELRAAARRDGVTIGVTDSYRSYDAQVDVARRKGLYSQGGLAAQPGTSQHGWGLAVDLDLDARAQTWMRTNAARFGFAEDTPREPWHWAYQR